MRRVHCLIMVAFVTWTTAHAGRAYADDDTTEGSSDDTGKSGQAQLANGDEVRWGLAFSAVRFRVSRRADQVGRLRDYQPNVDFFSGQFGFSVAWLPHGSPARLELSAGNTLQLFSIGFQIMGQLRTEIPAQSELSFILSLGMFNNVVGIGIGIDLYRGVPILGANGIVGGDTAYTGLLSWAVADEGEITPENFVGILFIDVTSAVDAIRGMGGGS